jgi:hypothetical protein
VQSARDLSRRCTALCCPCAAPSRCAIRASSLCSAPPADPPKGAETWTATEGGFSCALDLVRHIRANYGSHFCVSVAGYPEGHPNVIKKVEAGRELTASERKRLITEEDGDYVCSDEVRSDGCALPAPYIQLREGHGSTSCSCRRGRADAIL